MGDAALGLKGPRFETRYFYFISRLNLLNLQPNYFTMSNIRITKQFSFETGHALYG
jgi:hypothetical protein